MWRLFLAYPGSIQSKSIAALRIVTGGLKMANRRHKRECGRNLELIWLTGRLKPDFKTIADFRHMSSIGEELPLDMTKLFLIKSDKQTF